jgi:hypothetical protein
MLQDSKAREPLYDHLGHTPQHVVERHRSAERLSVSRYRAFLLLIHRRRYLVVRSQVASTGALTTACLAILR